MENQPIILAEYTSGNHIYMKIQLANKRIEEIDVYYGKDGKESYKTSADNTSAEIREQIIKAFNELY